MIESAIHHLKKIIFWLKHARRFKQYSFRSTILDSLKIQGHQFISVGRNVFVHKYVWLGAYQENSDEPILTIGDGTCIGNFNHITAVRKVVIGKQVLTADKVYVSDNTHNFENPSLPILQQGISFKKEVIIGDGAWIGENVCIIGASVGKNSVVGANSVVTRDIPDYCVAVGSPAQVIKQYDFEHKKWLTIK